MMRSWTFICMRCHAVRICGYIIFDDMEVTAVS